MQWGWDAARRWLRAPWMPYVLVGVLAFAVRLVYVLAVTQHRDLGFDSGYYDLAARELREWHTYNNPFALYWEWRVTPSALFPPGYPMALALFALPFKPTHLTHLLVSAGFGTTTVVLIAVLANRIAGRRAALAAGVVAALHPMLFGADGALMAESLYGVFVVGALLLTYAAIGRPRARTFAALAFVIALSALIRGESFLLLALPVIAARHLGWRRAASTVAMCLAVVIAVQLPWAFRNHQAFGAWMLGSNNGSTVVGGANCASTYFGEKLGFWDVACLNADRPGAKEMSETALNDRIRAEGLHYAHHHLGRMPIVAEVRLARTWGLYRPFEQMRWEGQEGRVWRYQLAGWALSLVSLPMAIAGFVALRRRCVVVWPLVACLVIVSVSSIVTYGNQRFRFAAEPALIIGAVALVVCRSRPSLRDVTDLEADYLVVGAGASGMSFIDSILTHTDRDVVLVDRRHRPGGHWLDAYPFVRLHQPSANYGVNSRQLGTNRIEASGINTGFYEQASAHEICDYYHRVLEEDFIPSGRVHFLRMSDYRGSDADGHHVTSLLTGEDTVVKARRKLVDATYVESEIPSKHTPSFEVDDGVRFVPPNGLVDLAGPARRFTVIGAGKTAADTCCWLRQNGVAPDAIRWIKPREAWIFNRTFTQPLDLVGTSYMQLQARWIDAAAHAEDAEDFPRRLEACGVFLRTDPSVDPTMFRGSTMAPRELDVLREVENVVRLGRIRRIGTERVELTDGSVPAERDEVFVDCTANGVRAVVPRPLFEPDRITMEYVTVGVIPWSASVVGYVEATREDDAEKNRLCPPVIFTGWSADALGIARAGMIGTRARGGEPDIAAWSDSARLNPAGGAGRRRDDPDIAAAFASIAANGEAAMRNFERILGPWGAAS